MGTQILRMDDETLGYFVQEYCSKHDIRPDWRVFKTVFSGANEYTAAHAIELIEMYADLCCLRKAKEMEL